MKAGQRVVVYDFESVRVINRVRELLKQYTHKEVAEKTGYSRSNITLIANGNRHKHTGTIIDINSLELKRSSKLCRSCGEPCKISTKTLRCVVCELLELGKEGLIKITPEGKEDE